MTELRNRLSHHLRLVRRGQPILVRDRDRVIARIEPAGPADGAAGAEAETSTASTGVSRWWRSARAFA